MLFAGFLVYSAQYNEKDAIIRRGAASHFLFEVGVSPIAKLGVRFLQVFPLAHIDLDMHRTILRSLLWVVLISSALGWTATFNYIANNMEACLDLAGLPKMLANQGSLAFIFYVQWSMGKVVLARQVSWNEEWLTFKQDCRRDPSRFPLRPSDKGDIVIGHSGDAFFIAIYKLYIECVTICHAGTLR